MPKPPDPSLPVRAAAAAARLQVAAALANLRTVDVWRLPDIVRRELARLEPVLARALTDAQLLAFLKAAQATADRAGLTAQDEPEVEPGAGAVVAPAPLASPFGYGYAPAPGPLLPYSTGYPPSLPPDSPHLPDHPDDPPPLVRFPAIERAAADLRARHAFTPQDYANLSADCRTTAFTVARATTLDAVEKVRQAVIDDVETGGTLKAFKGKVVEALGGSALADHQIEAVYRTQVGRAVASGQRAVMESPMVVDAFPYLLWSATHDGRVRPDHLAMEKAGLDGTAVYRADDPIFDWCFPPVGWQCRCVAVSLSVRDAARYGCREAQRWAESGEPPATPQHVGKVPIVLPKGWVPTTARVAAAV